MKILLVIFVINFVIFSQVEGKNNGKNRNSQILKLKQILKNWLGHGMIMDPINRASRWRFNRSAPHDWNDHAQWCGSFDIQHFSNGGKCGLCGDNWADPRPRPHELGGFYGEGFIVKSYIQGSEIDVIIRVTSNHLGKFTFELCNLDNEGESDECFQKNHVYLADGNAHFEIPHYVTRDFIIPLKLPQKLHCEHCVLRWTYVGANQWYICDGEKLGSLVSFIKNK